MKFSTAALYTVAAIAAIAAIFTTTNKSAVRAEPVAANIDLNTNVNTDDAHRALRSDARVTPSQAKDGTIAIFKIGQSVAPLLSGMFGSGKHCHQLACWVAAPNYDCQFAAANEVQRELAQGCNTFAVESSGPTGMWVRYWRTQFTPPDRGAVADGTCGGGSHFEVSNCQQTGKVYC